MNFLSLLVQLIAGWGGGVIAGCASAGTNLGKIWNSIFGIIGGAFGGQLLLRLFAADESATDMQIFFWSVAGGALGGSLFVLAVGCIKNFTSRKE